MYRHLRVGASITVGTIFVFLSRATGWEARATALIDAPILKHIPVFDAPDELTSDATLSCSS